MLIYEGAITAHALGGDLIGKVPVTVLLDDEGLVLADGERFWRAVRDKYGENAPDETNLTPSERGMLAEITGSRWYSAMTGAEGCPVAFGYFDYADSLSWEDGTLQIDCIIPKFAHRDLFIADDPMFRIGGAIDEYRFSHLEFAVQLTDLCFERNDIELLTALEGTNQGRMPNRGGGRSQKWDWAGAMMAVVVLANSVDGISQSRGEQAKVEAAMANWFVRTTGDQPHPSQIRDYAQKVMAELAGN